MNDQKHLSLDNEENARNYKRLAFVIGMGLFASTFSQTGVVGLYLFRFLLKDQLHEGPLRVALFLQIAAMPWNIKIIAGIISDALPIFGSRRKIYLAVSSLLAGILWLGIAFVPPAYTPLVIMATLMNVALVFVSTISGGILVEGGQTYGATGRLSSLRVFFMNVAGLGVPVGAFLASQALGISAFVAAVPLFLLFIAATFFYKEERTAHKNTQIFLNLWAQFKIAIASKNLWFASGLLFLVQFAPGFGTPLMFYQTDVLHFSDSAIGTLALFSAISGAVGAFSYAYFCKRYTLKTLIYASVIITAITSLFYLGYNDWKSAVTIEIAYALVYNLAQLPLFDLAARATPKGSEALGYSIIMSVWNWGILVADLTGSALYEKMGVSFKSLVWINGSTTLLVLFAVPFLPKLLINQKED